MSFRANTFSRFAKKYDIRMEAHPYDPYGLVNMETLKESKDFIVFLSVGDRVYNFSLTFPEYRTELPPIEDVLEHLANEVAIMERFGKNPEGFAKRIKRPLPIAKTVIEQACSEAGPFKLFIGPAAYAEFLQITEERG